MNRKLVVFSFVLLALSIGLGAFGAHALKKIADASGQQSFETAVRYQFYAAFILLIMAFRPESMELRFKRWLRLFILGMGLFSGSIYGIVFTKIAQVSIPFLGPITPLGGALMIISLGMIALQFQRNASEK
ncbi:MAG: DUF423 domain-containing protein [Flavobacteriia bacterium]|nr:DUF423 domain-containing protein [Flavobacteriia bacterium]